MEKMEEYQLKAFESYELNFKKKLDKKKLKKMI